MRYSDIQTFTQTGLVALGYGSANPDVLEPVRTMPLIKPGPITSALQQKASPQAMLFLQVGNGVGPTVEQAYDKVFLTVRVAGEQSNYQYAEDLAYAVDKMFLSVGSPKIIGSARVLYITRTGGAPQLVDFDSANRYHFQTTYITEAQR